MGDGGKLNQQKIWKTESAEKLHLQFSECRKITTHKCSKHNHALMLKRNLRWVMGKTESMENSCLQFSECRWNISVGHYEKIKKWLPFLKYRSYRKISNYWLLKVWVSGFLSVNGNGISASAIMKNLKNGHYFVNIDHMVKFQITDPPQSLGLWFSECQLKQNINISHYEKIEKCPPFCISRKLEIWIFCWFSFPNFLLVQFSPLPILGSVSTFMHCYT